MKKYISEITLKKIIQSKLIENIFFKNSLSLIKEDTNNYQETENLVPEPKSMPDGYNPTIQQYNAAFEEYKKNNYTQAIKLIEEMGHQNPDDTEFTWLGKYFFMDILNEKNKKGAYAPSFQYAIKLYAKCYENLKDFDKRDEVLRKIVKFYGSSFIFYEDFNIPGIIKAFKSEKSENLINTIGEINVLSFYRFPQLNGGYFEMAKSLLDENKMKQIWDEDREYKKYEKKGELYGLIYMGESKPRADIGAAESIRAFFNNILEWDYKKLGNALNKFFKNRMVKVGEYYLIDNAFLRYCILYNMNPNEAKQEKNFNDVVTKRDPKIIKASATFDELSGLQARDNISNAYQNKHITIDQMFDQRKKHNK